MKKRYFWLAVPGFALVIIVAGMIYTTHFASAVSQAHTAPGIATATGELQRRANCSFSTRRQLDDARQNQQRDI